MIEPRQLAWLRWFMRRQPLFQHPEHIGKPHEWWIVRYQIDRYRAPCCPTTGCRNCGSLDVGPYCYCSLRCQREFDTNHCWLDAREEARRRAMIDGILVCSECGEPCRQDVLQASAEVHHKIPKRKRVTVSCLHHQANLEVLCYVCHRTKDLTRTSELCRTHQDFS